MGVDMVTENSLAPEAPDRLVTLIAALEATEAEIASLVSRSETIRSEIAALRALADEVPMQLVPLSSQRLNLIRGVDDAAADLLNSLGITAFADIAALTPEDVQELGGMLGDARRISKEGWIEQAALLARDVTTVYAERILRGHRISIAVAPVGDLGRVGLSGDGEQPQVAGEAVAVIAPEAPAATLEVSSAVIDFSSRRRKAAQTRQRRSGSWIALTASLLLMLGIAAKGTGLTDALLDVAGQPACAEGSAVRGCSHLAAVGF